MTLVARAMKKDLKLRGHKTRAVPFPSACSPRTSYFGKWRGICGGSTALQKPRRCAATQFEASFQAVSLRLEKPCARIDLLRLLVHGGRPEEAPPRRIAAESGSSPFSRNKS